jgi:hypothetical protein
VLNKKIKIGRRIKLPPWWFSKVGADITSEGNYCVSKMINAYFKKKKININELLWGDCPHNGEIPYTRKDLVKLNKINTKFYLCGWAYEGLDEKTDNIMFVNMLRPYIVPPTDTKGKTPIYFALATPKELCDKVDELKDEESRRQALNDFVIYAHCLPIFSLPAFLTTNQHKPYVCENCLHVFSRSTALKRHLENGCFTFHSGAEYIPTEGLRFNNYKNMGKLPAHISMDVECYLEKVQKNSSEAIHINGNVINPAMKTETKYTHLFKKSFSKNNK